MFSFSFSAVANDRRNKILNIIDEEYKEIQRLSKQTGSKNPDLLLRMAELLLEKARHYKDEENLKFSS